MGLHTDGIETACQRFDSNFVGPDLAPLTDMAAEMERGTKRVSIRERVKQWTPPAIDSSDFREGTIEERAYAVVTTFTTMCDGRFAPRELTQEGIGKLIGKTRAHVAITMKRLVLRGMVDSHLARIINPDGSQSKLRRMVYTVCDEADMAMIRAFAAFAKNTLGTHGCMLLKKELELSRMHSRAGVSRAQA